MPWIFRQLMERFGVAASFASLVRIHVWIALGLLVIVQVKPPPPHDQLATSYNTRIDSEWVREIGADRNDWRGFHPSPGDPERFRVAWTSGSSIQNIGEGYYEFLPKLVRDRIPEIDGRPVDIDIYFLSGIRLWDEYIAVLDAIDRNVDMLVVTLNPLWVFNDTAIQGWANVNPIAAQRVFDEPEAWPLALSLITPSDALVGLLGAELTGLSDRSAYGALVRDRFDDFTVLDRSSPPPEPEELGELARIAAMQIPVFFWGEHRDDRPSGLSRYESQAALLELVNPDTPTWNRQILGWMAAAIVESEIPTFVYLAPLAPESVAQPEVDLALRGIEDHLREYEDNFASDRVHFGPESLVRALGPLSFNDLIHVGEAPELADHISGLLCEFASVQGLTPTCLLPEVGP